MSRIGLRAVRILRAMRIALLSLLAVVVLAATGCQRPFGVHTDAPRTQYETYDRVRNRYVPVTETDVFGQERPALRARLQRRG